MLATARIVWSVELDLRDVAEDQGYGFSEVSSAEKGLFPYRCLCYTGSMRFKLVPSL